jgi:hypothetical protein
MNLHHKPLSWLLWFAASAAMAADSAPATNLKIKELNHVHFSHTDVGFTDSPSVCRDYFTNESCADYATPEDPRVLKHLFRPKGLRGIFG